MKLSPGDSVRLGPRQARILFTEDQIRERIGAMGRSLQGRLGNSCPVFIGLLHGGFMFVSDLIRAFDAPHEIDFLKVSRYDPRQKDPTAYRMMHDLRSNIHDRDVVVVEGIRTHGAKVEYVDRFLRLHAPRRIEYCTMVCAAGANRRIPVSETGFTIDNEFVVGYGLDYREQYRNLAFISALEPPPERIPAAV